MKYLVVTAIIVFSFPPSLSLGQVFDSKQLTEPNLSEGQCHTMAASKVYLSDLKGTDANKSILNEIGATTVHQLSNTDIESYYFCKIKCHLQLRSQFFWITQKDRNENFKNMDGFVCTGIGIKDVPISPTLSIKTTVAIPFFAVQSTFPEIHEQLKAMSYKVTGEQLVKLLTDFFNTLQIIHDGYSLARSDMFQAAATELQTYLPSQPESWSLIKTKVKKLEVQYPQPKTRIGDLKTGEDLVNMIFLTNGLFLRYVD